MEEIVQEGCGIVQRWHLEARVGRMVVLDIPLLMFGVLGMV